MQCTPARRSGTPTVLGRGHENPSRIIIIITRRTMGGRTRNSMVARRITAPVSACVPAAATAFGPDDRPANRVPRQAPPPCQPYRMRHMAATAGVVDNRNIVTDFFSRHRWREPVRGRGRRFVCGGASVTNITHAQCVSPRGLLLFGRKLSLRNRVIVKGQNFDVHCARNVHHSSKNRSKLCQR